uniref:Methyltransferase n=1 Tax=Cucumis melo TaxID=3656 RepID=A0A9I9EMV3_CUCME
MGGFPMFPYIISTSHFFCPKKREFLAGKSVGQLFIGLVSSVEDGIKEYVEVKPGGIEHSELFRGHIVRIMSSSQLQILIILATFKVYSVRLYPFLSMEPETSDSGSISNDATARCSGVGGACSTWALGFNAVLSLIKSQKCYDFIKKDATLLNKTAITIIFCYYILLPCVLSEVQFTCKKGSNLALAKVDISRLPFSSGSVDVVHAGATLHCWPSPSNVVSIVLKTYSNSSHHFL